MSILGISSSMQLSSMQTNYQQLRKQFTQLGQDLSAGSLTKAQTDFVTLSQAASAELGSNSALTQSLNTLGQALQSGNLSAAQQAFSSMPPGLVGPNAVDGHSHWNHGHSGLRQTMDQLGQALQSGNLTAAQQAFAALQQGWPQMAGTSSTSVAANATVAASTGVFSVSA
jgi:predicted lipoprotein